MERFRYLIVGGGMAADAAVRGIRDVDPDGTIGLLSSEDVAPYKRPPLSKGLWKGEPEEKIRYRTAEFGVTLRLGCHARAIDLTDRRLIVAPGGSIGYDRLLLATGASPRRLPSTGRRVIHFRTFADYARLRELAGAGTRFAVVGSGFIGMEIAAALALNGKEVTMLFPGATLGGRVFPPDLGRSLNDHYRGKGVELLPGTAVERIDTAGKGVVVRTKGNGADGSAIPFDGAVVGIGVTPNVSLAADAKLALGDGIRVDPFLRTSHPDVWAAGDVAEFLAPALGRRIRVEHEDNARTMGRAAGRALAGAGEPYTHLPFFYSDLFDLGYEAVGTVDASLDTVADWSDPFRKGVVYYREGRRVRGVLLWNVWEQVDAARALIASPEEHEAESLAGRIPNR